jgi:hypothetical protein
VNTDEPLVRNKLLRFFEEPTTAELRLALDEVKLWRDGVARGLVKPEQANRYIESAKRIVNAKLHVLGFPEFPS